MIEFKLWEKASSSSPFPHSLVLLRLFSQIKNYENEVKKFLTFKWKRKILRNKREKELRKRKTFLFPFSFKNRTFFFVHLSFHSNFSFSLHQLQQATIIFRMNIVIKLNKGIQFSSFFIFLSFLLSSTRIK